MRVWHARRSQNAGTQSGACAALKREADATGHSQRDTLCQPVPVVRQVRRHQIDRRRVNNHVVQAVGTEVVGQLHAVYFMRNGGAPTLVMIPRVA